MIKFEIEKLTFDYFRVVKISNDGFIHFISENGKIEKLQGMKNFYTEVNKKMGFSTFQEPKKMAILFYDNCPLYIDFQVLKISDLNMRKEISEKWETSLPKFIESIEKSVTTGVYKDKDAYVDGKYLYFLSKKKKEKNTDNEKEEYKRINSISQDGSFMLVSCIAINLQSPSVYLLKEENQKSYRKVIVYKVKKENGEILECISPTIANIKYRSKETGQVDFDRMNKYFTINLNFVLDAAKIVGERYGYEATEFLGLEEILIDMNTINLYQLEEHIRNLTPSNISFFEAIAWLIGFSYKENNIMEMVKFRSLLSKLFDVYLTSKKEVDRLNIKIKNLSEKSVKLKSFEILTNEYKMYKNSNQKNIFSTNQNYLF